MKPLNCGSNLLSIYAFTIRFYDIYLHSLWIYEVIEKKNGITDITIYLLSFIMNILRYWYNDRVITDRTYIIISELNYCEFITNIPTDASNLCYGS